MIIIIHGIAQKIYEIEPLHYTYEILYMAYSSTILKKKDKTYCLGGVGIILAFSANLITDIRICVSPSSGGDSTVNSMWPCAVPVQDAALDETDRLTPSQPDHGHNTSENVSDTCFS